MKVDCQQYRKSMELVVLRKRLNEGISDPEKRKEAEERIKILEEELDID